MGRNQRQRCNVSKKITAGILTILIIGTVLFLTLQGPE